LQVTQTALSPERRDVHPPPANRPFPILALTAAPLAGTAVASAARQMVSAAKGGITARILRCSNISKDPAKGAMAFAVASLYWCDRMSRGR
jgi:hypothetical protein